MEKEYSWDSVCIKNEMAYNKIIDDFQKKRML